MSRRGAIALFWGWVIAAAVFLCFPGIVPFNRPRPFIFGLPFVLAWVALWIVLALIVFLRVDRVLDRHRPGGS